MVAHLEINLGYFSIKTGLGGSTLSVFIYTLLIGEKEKQEKRGLGLHQY